MKLLLGDVDTNGRQTAELEHALRTAWVSLKTYNRMRWSEVTVTVTAG